MPSSAQRSRGERLRASCAVLTLLAAGSLLVDCHSPGRREPVPAATPAPTGDQSPEPPLQNTLRWKTASEVDNFGFDVYRASSPDGPFERLTEQPIPGAGTTDEPQHYVFVDDTIEAGRPYWYFVESISMMGVRERFTPVFGAKAKGVPEVDASEGAAGAPSPEGAGDGG